MLTRQTAASFSGLRGALRHAAAFLSDISGGATDRVGQWAVRALAALGRTEEAIQYAEASRGLNDSPVAIARVNSQGWALALSIITRAPTPHFALQRVLLFLHAGPFLYGDGDVRTALAKPFEVQVLDERRQGQLPGFLPVVVELAELLRVHAQFARHLHLGVREVMPRPRVDPNLKPLGNPIAGH